MRNSRYNVKILPLFEKDLNQIVDYISFQLHKPKSALNLIEDVYKAITERQKNPTIFEPFRSIKNRERPYYVIRVRNYYIFYVVVDTTMEVRRILYSKRDFTKLI